MDALTNAHTRQGGTRPSHAGFTSNVSPEAKGSQTGVSVRYAQEPDKQWFVLRATYNRGSKAYELMKKKKVEAFFPMHYVQKKIDGKKKRVLSPLLPNVLFIYATRKQTKILISQTPELSYLNYYYNHFQTDQNGKNPPLIIEYKDMMNFIRATSVDNEHLLIVTPERCRYKSGDRVRIIDGDFKGVEGKVARVAGQQRVIIEIEGLCTVATAYIPNSFLEFIEPKDAAQTSK